MKLLISRRCCRLFALLLLGLSVGSAHAQTVADLAGSWHGYSLSTPNLVTVQKNAQNLVTDIQPLTMFQTDPETINIAANGTFGGSASGTFALGSGGSVVATVTPPDPGTTTFRITRSNDVMVAVENNSGSQDMIFLVKAPASLATSDLGGNWTIISYRTPAFFSLDRADSGFPDVVTAIQGANSFNVQTGTMTVNGGNGSISGTLQGPFTGQYQSYDSGSGLVSVNITPSGDAGFSLPLYINQSKDIMLGYQTAATTEDNRMELLIFIKAPASTPTAVSYKGNWHITSFDTPSVLNQVMDGNGHLTQVDNVDAFKVNNTQRFTVGSDAFLTGQFDTPGIGSISVPSAGQATVSVTHEDNSNGGATLNVNAGQNFMIATQVDGYSQELTIGMRGPQVTGSTTKQMGLISFKGSLYWAADTTRKLQSNSDITTSNWVDVPSTANTHTFTPSAGTQFFRTIDP